jgi:hypothetical protein
MLNNLKSLICTRALATTLMPELSPGENKGKLSRARHMERSVEE